MKQSSQEFEELMYTPNRQDYQLKNVQTSAFSEKNQTNFDSLLMKNYKNKNDQSFRSQIKESVDMSRCGVSIIEQKSSPYEDNYFQKKLDEVQKQQNLFQQQLQLQIQNQNKLHDQNKQILLQQNELSQKYEFLQSQFQQSQKVKIDTDLKDLKIQIFELQEQIKFQQSAQTEMSIQLDKVAKESINKVQIEIQSLKFLQESPEQIKQDIKLLNQKIQQIIEQNKIDQQQNQQNLQNYTQNLNKANHECNIGLSKIKEVLQDNKLQQNYIESDLIKIVQLLQEHQQNIQEFSNEVNWIKNQQQLNYSFK